MGDFFENNLWEEEPDFAKDDDYGEDGDGQFEENENYYGAQHVIALVDCHPDMFEMGTGVFGDDEIESSAIQLSIKLVQTLLQQTIEQTVIRKTGKRNGVGLLLYNTKSRSHDHAKKSNEYSHGESGDNVDDDDDQMDDEDDDDDDDQMDDESAEDDHADEQRAETSVHKLLDLEPPGIQHVQTIRKILVDKRRQQKKTDRDLKADFCASADDPDPTIAPLQTALEEATRMFLNSKCVRDPTKNAKGKNEYDTKSIWIFTNQANPYSDEQNLLIQNIANEAKEQRIAIIVWPLNSNKNIIEKNEVFVSPFFESIASEVLFDQRFRSYVELQDGLELFYRTMVKKRRTYYGPMHILRPGQSVGNNRSIDDPAIMIDWYSVVQLSRKPGKVQIDAATKKETVKIRLLLEKDTGKEVTRHWAKPTAEQREYQKSQPGLQRLRRFHNFANELVPMSTDDMKKITQNANGGYAPGLTILGFKPRNSIPSHHSILKPFLIFPNDTEVQGSENAFMHLHAAMLRQNVLALGENLQRETSQSRLVAIYPFEETDHLPPGMYVKLLPFKDNIRKIVPDAASEELDRRKEQQKAVARNRQNNELDYPDRYGSNNAAFENDVLFSDRDSQDSITGNIASEELIKAAIDLMSRQGLSSAEIGEDFENKALTEFFSYLKSVAFDTTKEENNYDTDVNRDAVLKIAGKEIDAFRSRLPIDVERPKVSKSRKRIVKIIPDDSGIDWNELYRSDEIGTCKVDQLKKYLRSVGLSTSGRKADLVGRVTKSLEEKCTADNTISIMKKEDGNIKQEYKLLDWV